MVQVQEVKPRKCSIWYRPSCIPTSIVSVLIILILTLYVHDQMTVNNEMYRAQEFQKVMENCNQNCRMTLVESIPEGLNLNSTVHMSTYDAWVQLIELAKNEINIGSYYWSLQGKEFDHPTADKGKDIFARLMAAGTKRNIKIQIAKDRDSEAFPNYDTKDLTNAGAAEVRTLNFTKLIGSGIIHTKMWVVDDSHAYVGSANFDWRSLTQVKELGLLITNCSCFVRDLKKIFDVYWYLGKDDSSIPKEWPKEFSTQFNSDHPMDLLSYNTYISSSPPQFCPKGRTVDIDAILRVIDSAVEFVHIAVMDYFPATLYTPKPEFWPVIDDKLRTVALDKKVKIKLLMSKWNDTRKSAYNFLKSLQDLNGVYSHVDIQIKLFEVPSTPDQARIPYARVNHNKYMVTDNGSYIGTSNWSGDYFISTGGVGIITIPRTSSSNDIRTQVQHIFERDWTSSYARTLDEVLSEV